MSALPGPGVRFFTAAALVNCLELAQKQYQLERFLTKLDKTDLLICDDVGYLSFSRSGAELLSRSSLTATNARACSSPATCRSANGRRSFRASG